MKIEKQTATEIELYLHFNSFYAKHPFFLA